MEAGVIATVENVSVKIGSTTILDNIHFTIRQHEQWAIIGRSGSGKTTFANALIGKIFYGGTISFSFPGNTPHSQKIVLIEQQHRFKNLSNTSEFYYQQRFNSSDAENSMTVSQALEQYANNAAKTDLAYWTDMLHLNPLLREPLIQLSNGENKRLQLAEALLSDPGILIMDNPFIGLDKEGRKTLQAILDKISSTGLQFILITTADELPQCITNVGILEDGSLKTFSKQEYYSIAWQENKKETFLLNTNLLQQLTTETDPGFDIAIKMINVSVTYGNKKILDAINWNVNRGDCWNVSGPNGAGKSTLLSLINADNPQAYANEIYLFDKRKGRGESIWDIKRRIGYVSPELHLFFEQHTNTFDVIASGLFDTIGLFRQLSSGQEDKVTTWIELLQLQTVRLKLLSQLSLGQQRMVLLARALVKNPPLLILDEPCQGLDDEQADYFKSLVDQLCRQFGTTLLYVSHYEKDIPSCVTNYLRLENGRQV